MTMLLVLASRSFAQTPVSRFPDPAPRAAKPPTPAAPADAATAAQTVAPPGAARAGPNGHPQRGLARRAHLIPGAEFVGSFDAGRGQRYYLFGTNAVVPRDRELLQEHPEAEG